MASPKAEAALPAAGIKAGSPVRLILPGSLMHKQTGKILHRVGKGYLISVDGDLDRIWCTIDQILVIKTEEQ